MKVNVKVKANSRQRKIEKDGQNSFSLWVKAPAKEGKANEESIRILSEYFGVPKSSVIILRGHKNRKKEVEILLP